MLLTIKLRNRFAGSIILKLNVLQDYTVMFIANHSLSVTVALVKQILLILYIAKQILAKRCLVKLYFYL